MRRELVAGALVVVAVAAAGASAAMPTHAGAALAAVSAARAGSDSCMPDEQAARVRALEKYRAAVPRARRAYFRTHPSPKARRAFVRRQQARLRALEAAAACDVIPPGARVVASISIPTDGNVFTGAGGVWVIDREGGATNDNRTPAGSLYRVDPTTNAVTDQIHGVMGAQAGLAFGSVWIASFAFNSVFRVDLLTHQVTRLRSGPSEDEAPYGMATTPTGVWVANHHGGSVAELDPASGAILRSLQLTAAGQGGPNLVVADGTELWVELADLSAVVQVDTVTATVGRRATVRGGTCGGLTADATRIWIAGAECGTRIVSAVDRRTGRVNEVPTPGPPLDVVVAFGSVWAVTESPSRLLRIDPGTLRVVGSLQLPARPWNIAADADGLWVRIDGSLLRIVPD